MKDVWAFLKALGDTWVWKMAWRETRSKRRRLALFSFAVLFGVMALTAIRGLRMNVERGVEDQAKILLGGAVKVSTREAFESEELKRLLENEFDWALERGFSSMVRADKRGNARLVQVRGVTEKFPLYGEVVTEPADAWEKMQAEGGIVLEASALVNLGAETGDLVWLGELALEVRGAVVKSASRSGRFSGFAPEGYIRNEDVDRTGLLGDSSLAVYQIYYKDRENGGGSRDVLRFLETAGVKDSWRVETADQRSERLGDTLRNMEIFLGLLGFVSVFLGGIGIAIAMHTHVMGKRKSVAVLRVMGAGRMRVLAIFVIQTVLLGIAGSLIGVLLGVGVQYLIPWLWADALPWDFEVRLEWGAIWSSLGVGIGVSLLFALFPLRGVLDISPLSVLREAEGVGSEKRMGRRIGKRIGKNIWKWGMAVFVLAGVMGMAMLQTGDWKMGAGFTVGFLVVLVVLWGMASGLTWGIRKLSGLGGGFAFRQGVANLYRPGNLNVSFILSLGLGCFLVLALTLVAGQLLRQVAVDDQENSPNLYLVDVQDDQVEPVYRVLEEMNLPVLEDVPMVTMRLKEVKGVSVGKLREQKAVESWVLTREYRSTYRMEMTFSETLVSGEWWDQAYSGEGVVPVSLEEGIAEDLGLKVGDSLILDVQGVEIATEVASIRHVDWSRFNLNFFMVFPDGVLEAAPGFRVVTTRVKQAEESGVLQKHIAHEVPGVSAIDLTLILGTLLEIFGRIQMVVNLLLACLLGTSVVLLIGAVLISQRQRTRELTLLRTLGASHRVLKQILAWEFLILGMVAGLSGVVLAYAASVAIVHFQLERLYHWEWLPGGITLAAVMAGTWGIGWLMTQRLSKQAPLAVLRNEIDES